MEAGLKLLKTQGLNDSDTNVEKLQKKRFYDITDELRKNDSEAFAVKMLFRTRKSNFGYIKRREKEKKERRNVRCKIEWIWNREKKRERKRKELAKKIN